MPKKKMYRKKGETVDIKTTNSQWNLKNASHMWFLCRANVAESKCCMSFRSALPCPAQSTVTQRLPGIGQDECVDLYSSELRGESRFIEYSKWDA